MRVQREITAKRAAATKSIVQNIEHQIGVHLLADAAHAYVKFSSQQKLEFEKMYPADFYKTVAQCQPPSGQVPGLFQRRDILEHLRQYAQVVTLRLPDLHAVVDLPAELEKKLLLARARWWISNSWPLNRAEVEFVLAHWPPAYMPAPQATGGYARLTCVALSGGRC